mmetsp:Transcript_40956/g.135668  ORF Transcript_40956/g.135668 Transcript_40956/m.135668 type:complete len:247 (+) Transcript_40956:1482-2222(+)
MLMSSRRPWRPRNACSGGFINGQKLWNKRARARSRTAPGARPLSRWRARRRVVSSLRREERILPHQAPARDCLLACLAAKPAAEGPELTTIVSCKHRGAGRAASLDASRVYYVAGVLNVAERVCVRSVHAMSRDRSRPYRQYIINFSHLRCGVGDNTCLAGREPLCRLYGSRNDANGERAPRAPLARAAHLPLPGPPRAANRTLPTLSNEGQTFLTQQQGTRHFSRALSCRANLTLSSYGLASSLA